MLILATRGFPTLCTLVKKNERLITLKIQLNSNHSNGFGKIVRDVIKLSCLMRASTLCKDSLSSPTRIITS